MRVFLGTAPSWLECDTPGDTLVPIRPRPRSPHPRWPCPAGVLAPAGRTGLCCGGTGVHRASGDGVLASCAILGAQCCLVVPYWVPSPIQQCHTGHPVPSGHAILGTQLCTAMPGVPVPHPAVPGAHTVPTGRPVPSSCDTGHRWASARPEVPGPSAQCQCAEPSGAVPSSPVQGTWFPVRSAQFPVQGNPVPSTRWPVPRLGHPVPTAWFPVPGRGHPVPSAWSGVTAATGSQSGLRSSWSGLPSAHHTRGYLAPETGHPVTGSQ